MPSTVEVNVDPEDKQATLPPTTKEGSKEGTPMDLASEEVKQGKNLNQALAKNK